MTEGERTNERPSEEVADIVLHRYAVSILDAQHAVRGEESVGWRGTSSEGDRFVQLFPSWRTVEELVWCDAVAQAAATVAGECINSVPSDDGQHVTTTAEGHVMVFPFVEGVHPDGESFGLRAAAMLAQVHRGIVAAWDPSLGPRPGGRRWPAGRADVMVDPELDAWEQEVIGIGSFPIHGDFYKGNLLTAADRIVGVVDWTDAALEAMEQEVSWALWEFMHDDSGEDLMADAVEPFLDAYLDAGGPAPVARPFNPLPWIRRRLRAESREWFLDPRSAIEHDAYFEAERVAFERLRDRRLPGR